MDLGSSLKRILSRPRHGKHNKKKEEKDEGESARSRGKASAVAGGGEGGSNRSNQSGASFDDRASTTSTTTTTLTTSSGISDSNPRLIDSSSHIVIGALHNLKHDRELDFDFDHHHSSLHHDYHLNPPPVSSTTAPDPTSPPSITSADKVSSQEDSRDTGTANFASLAASDPASSSPAVSLLTSPSTADSERPAVVLQHPTPPVQHDTAPVTSAPSVTIDGSGVYNFTSQLSPARPPLRDQGPIIDVLPLESAAISEYDLPPPIHDNSHLAAPELTLPPSLDVSALQERLHNETQLQGQPHCADNSPSVPSTSANMAQPRPPQQRRIWVKRPGASATLVTIQEHDLVDDVRDRILQKYANSLGRTYDSPDVVLRIPSRSDGHKQFQPDRILGPEEEICKILDTQFPSGQTVSDALTIEIPPKRTPRPSPRHHHSHSNSSYQALEDYRPHESGTDYFPPMPPATLHTSNPHAAIAHEPRALTGILRLPEHSRSMSVLQTGQVPPLPSPGAATRRPRPKFARQHTSSPTVVAHATNSAANVVVNSPGPSTTQHLRGAGQRPRHDSNASERPPGIPVAPPLPTPPAPEAPPTGRGSPPPTPVPRDPHRGTKSRKNRKPTPTNGAKSSNLSLSAMLDGSVPPINVLIVEDNIINLKLLEAFMKRLKVRWSTAMNGQIAVNKWRAGGFHLVLMDIQLPIMSGLEATKEIRRLERVNSIGVFSSSTPSTPLSKTEGLSVTAIESAASSGTDGAEVKDGTQDKLNMEDGLFKSPVIIVALTASSLQSDRHEALAAGCNDFLTKPVNFLWLERKVKEWGCMQALIDFDGWRKWKDFSANTTTAAGSGSTASKANGKTSAASTGKSPVLDGVSKADLAAKAREKKAKRDKRMSTEANGIQVGLLAGSATNTAPGSPALGPGAANMAFNRPVVVEEGTDAS